MYDYHRPFYLPNVETITPFETEFSDSATTFFKVKYRIRKDCFKSRVSQKLPLSNIFDYTGKHIFKGFSFDRKKYFLLKEERTHENFYDVITETYGYAPENIFSKNGSASVQFCGHTESGQRKRIYLQLDRVNGLVYFQNADGTSDKTFKKNDTLVLHRPSVILDNEGVIRDFIFFECNSAEFTLIRDGVAPIPSCAVFFYQDGTPQTQSVDVFWLILYQKGFDYEGVFVEAPLYANLVRRTINPRNDTTNVQTLVQFFKDQPEIIKRTRLVDSLGNETTDATDANFASDGGLYNGKYNIEDSSVIFDNATGLWRRDIKLTDWKTF